MPYEVMEEEGLNKIPDLKIAQWIFTLKSNPVSITKTCVSSHPLSLFSLRTMERPSRC